MEQGLATAVDKARGGFQWCLSTFYRHRNIFILIFASASVILVGGKRRCFSIFLGELHEQFNSTKLELNMIGDSYAAAGFFLMPFVATVLLTYGRHYGLASISAGTLIFISCLASSYVPSPGWLFLTHTVIHGVGSALAMTSAALIVGEYFDRNHRFHVLTTTLVSGGPFGAIIFCPVYAYWIREDGWRMAFRYMGVVFLIEMLLAGVVYEPKRMDYDDLDKQAAADCATTDGARSSDKHQLKPEQQQEKPRRKIGFCTLKEMRDRPPIVLWILQRTVHNMVMYSLAMNLYDFEYDSIARATPQFNSSSNETTAAGDSDWAVLIKTQATKVQLCYTIGESLMFVAGMLFGDHIRGKLILVYLTGSGTLALTLFIWFFTRQVRGLQYVLGFISGLSIGTGNTMVYATAEEVMNLEGSVAFPMSRMGAGLGMLTAPLLSGLVIDRLSFSGFFLIQCGLSIISLCILAAITVMLKRLAHCDSLAAGGAALQSECSDSTGGHHGHSHEPVSAQTERDKEPGGY